MGLQPDNRPDVRSTTMTQIAAGDAPNVDARTADARTADARTADAPTADYQAVDAWVSDPETGQDPDPEPRPRSSRRRRIAAAAAVLAAAAAVAIVLLGSGSSPRANSRTGLPPGYTTAAVTRRTLTESSTVDGTLGYGKALEVYDRLAGTFTWLPVAGTVIGRGGTLYRLNNLPIALMYGSVPAYRALKSGVSDGPDVAELNQNLIDLGYDPSGAITDENHFGEATAAAVRSWQKAEGLPETGEVELGRIVFAPGARRVTALHVALGQDPPGAPGPTGPSGNAARSNRPASKEPESEKPASKAPESEKPASKKPKSEEPKSEEPKSKKPKSEEPKSEEPKSEEPKSEEPKSKDPGSGSGGGEVVLTTTSTQQLVQLKVKPEQQQLARVGESAPVSLPGGRTDSGRIIEVGSVATESEKGGGGGGGGGGGEGESATITVTLALDRPVAHLDQAPVSVELVKSVRHGVLTVPATALTATGGGGYAIQVLEGGRRAELPVTPGMFANGYVQVEGAGLHEGQIVVEAG
jgi:peptidoglycan hydrolase-like protein with peptidoglycan-binding domain